ncbi:hypothetical protein MUP77_11295 [Candidatus Bathyarchaeota archaeon]|nr:hypothetical protein [Candidatus Bathyarchaeota archaeon]
MAATLDVAVEIAGLLLAAGVSYFNGDLKRLLSVDSTNLLTFLPFLALLSSMLYYEAYLSAAPLLGYILSSDLLTALLLSHMALLAMLAASTVQGLRSLPRDRSEISRKDR